MKKALDLLCIALAWAVIVTALFVCCVLLISLVCWVFQVQDFPLRVAFRRTMLLLLGACSAWGMACYAYRSVAKREGVK